MDGVTMGTKNTNRIIIVGTCQYTSLGIASLLDYLFYSKIVFYKRFSDIEEGSNDFLTIAAIDENDITYDDVIYLKNRMKKNNCKNLLILCDTILRSISQSVFNISCVYLRRNISLKELHPVIVDVLLHDHNENKLSLKPQLTGLESQILMMLSDGFTVSEISRIKNRNYKTISSHKYNLMKKMGMPNTRKSLSVLSLYLKSIRVPGEGNIAPRRYANSKERH
jgi:DNA-binding CsgD family transcriptional regulator